MKFLLLSNLFLILVQTCVSFTFRDVNIFVVTDTHSWMDAHPHPDNIPLVDATYGNVTSFITKMKEIASKEDKDIFFLDNGDVVDGTGLSNASPIDGEYLFPLLMKVPFDAMAIGNHECYDGVVIDEMISSDYISSRKGTYLTSNVLYTSTMKPLGDRYVVLEGTNSGVRLLVLGMLYNMEDNTDVVTIETVESTVASDWFKDALTTEIFDAVVVLFHIDYQDPLVDTVLNGIRDIAGNIPIQFLTGHSHIRGYNEPDAYSSNLEADYYFNTLGYASFDLPVNSTSPMEFHHEYVNVNVAELESIYTSVGGLEGNMATFEGLELDVNVDVVRTSMDLCAPVGCSPQHYSMTRGMNQTHSMYGLFMYDVIPSQLFTPPYNTTQIMVQGTGLLRYDLYAGNVIIDDIWTLSPFNDGFKIISNVKGSDLIKALDDLNSVPTAVYDNRLRSPVSPAMSGLASYVTSSDPVGNEFYDVLACDFDATYVLKALEEVTDGTFDMEQYEKNNLTATTVWFAWAEEYLNSTCTSY